MLTSWYKSVNLGHEKGGLREHVGGEEDGEDARVAQRRDQDRNRDHRCHREMKRFSCMETPGLSRPYHSTILVQIVLC